MKKLIMLLGILLLAVVVTACNEEESDDGEITLWVQTSDDETEGKIMQETVDEFNEEYDGEYSAEIEFIPRNESGGGYEDKINAAVNTGDLPDVLTLDGPNTAAYAESGIIQSVDEYITDKDDLLDSIIEQGTYEDELYAVGYSESGTGIYYNEDMLKDAGIDLNDLPTVDNPWDWNQFMDLLQTLTEEYDSPAIDLQLDDNSEWLMYGFTPFLWSQGGQVINDEGTQSTGILNDENGLKTMKFIREMLENEYTTDSPVDNGFHTEKYPLLLSGSWTIEELNDEYEDVNFGIMPYPTSPDTNELVSPSGSWQYAMSATTDKEEAAGALVDFLTSTDAVADISLGHSVPPARKSSIEKIEGDISSQFEVLIDQNEKSAKARPVISEYPQVSRAFRETIADLAHIEGDSEIEALLNEKAEQIDEELQKR